MSAARVGVSAVAVSSEVESARQRILLVMTDFLLARFTFLEITSILPHRRFCAKDFRRVTLGAERSVRHRVESKLIAN
jgi:hypothetical protein